MNTNICHDYRKAKARNGWAITSFDFMTVDKVKIKAFGLKPVIPGKPLKDFYLLAGEELVISMPDGEALYQINKIQYSHDPHDLFSAELQYIQHLSGFKIIGQREPQQEQRALQWSQQKTLKT